MAEHTVVIEQCAAEASENDVRAKVSEMLAALPGIPERLRAARRVFIKVNLCPGEPRSYRGRPVDYTDPALLEAVALFVRQHGSAETLVGDGTDGAGVQKAATAQGHAAVIEKLGLRLVDLSAPPHRRRTLPQPAMFRWYELSRELGDIDLFVSLAKMKAHHLCGVTLSLKNLFGIPPNTVYGSPRAALHSALRLPGVLADMAVLFSPALCLVDGIVGANYGEWGGDPVSSGVLIAGDNPVATDAVAARCMGVDPGAQRGTPPFLNADNHIRFCSERGLGATDQGSIRLVGELPSGARPYTVPGAAQPGLFARMNAKRREVSRLARWYFDERERFVSDYAGELIALHGDRVLHHQKVGPDLIANLMQALKDQGIQIYDAFHKLVQAEEAELREPYDADC